jgi:hypothetical protein
VKLVMNPGTWPLHVIGDLLRAKCPRCGWVGWQHKSQWLHIHRAGVFAGGTGLTSRRSAPDSGEASNPPEEQHSTSRSSSSHSHHGSSGDSHRGSSGDHHHRHHRRRRTRSTRRWRNWLAAAGAVILVVALFSIWQAIVTR